MQKRALEKSKPVFLFEKPLRYTQLHSEDLPKNGDMKFCDSGKTFLTVLFHIPIFIKGETMKKPKDVEKKGGLKLNKQEQKLLEIFNEEEEQELNIVLYDHRIIRVERIKRDIEL